MMHNMSRDFLESQLEGLITKSYDPYRWWRRYKAKEELDEKRFSLRERIRNGDFEVSSYYYQAAHEYYLMEDKLKEAKDTDHAHEIRGLFMERYRRLIDEFEKEEGKRLRSLKSQLKKTFKLTKEELDCEMEKFDGTTLEFYDYLKTIKNHGNN